MAPAGGSGRGRNEQAAANGRRPEETLPLLEDGSAAEQPQRVVAHKSTLLTVCPFILGA